MDTTLIRWSDVQNYKPPIVSGKPMAKCDRCGAKRYFDIPADNPKEKDILLSDTNWTRTPNFRKLFRKTLEGIGWGYVLRRDMNRQVRSVLVHCEPCLEWLNARLQSRAVEDCLGGKRKTR